MNEEVLLEDTTLDDDVSSPDNDTLSIDAKLDRIEALLNEDIALRQSESEQLPVPELVSGSGTVTTSSGVEPNYAQYIYDLLSDSNIRVEVVEEKTIYEKQLNEYTVLESLGVVGIIIALLVIVVSFVNKYTFKRR